jgi:hypothetical protein
MLSPVAIKLLDYLFSCLSARTFALSLAIGCLEADLPDPRAVV